MPRYKVKKVVIDDLVKEFGNATFPRNVTFKTYGADGVVDDSLADQNYFLKHAGFQSFDIYKAGIVALMQMMNGRHKRDFNRNGVKALLSKKKDASGFKLVMYQKQNKVPKSPFYIRSMNRSPNFLNMILVTGYKGFDSTTDIVLEMDKKEIHPNLKYLFLGE